MARTQRTFDYEQVALVVIQDGNHCWVQAVDGEPWAKLSVESVDLPQPPAGHFWLKTWSENKNITANMFARGLLDTPGDARPVSQWVAVIAAKVVPNDI